MLTRGNQHWRGGGPITLRLAHTHAHAHATRVALYRRAANGEAHLISEISPFCGVGLCQTFATLPPDVHIQRGEGLDFLCEYKNSEAIPLHQGLNRAQEMCGAVIVYTPHDANDTSVSMFSGTSGTQRDLTGNSVGRVYTPSDGSMSQVIPERGAEFKLEEGIRHGFTACKLEDIDIDYSGGAARLGDASQITRQFRNLSVVTLLMEASST